MLNEERIPLAINNIDENLTLKPTTEKKQHHKLPRPKQK